MSPLVDLCKSLPVALWEDTVTLSAADRTAERKYKRDRLVHKIAELKTN
jgi:hypothetical protein